MDSDAKCTHSVSILVLLYSSTAIFSFYERKLARIPVSEFTNYCHPEFSSSEFNTAVNFSVPWRKVQTSPTSVSKKMCHLKLQTPKLYAINSCNWALQYFQLCSRLSQITRKSCVFFLEMICTFFPSISTSQIHQAINSECHSAKDKVRRR